jgi:CO/xanthine dehydrogenase FAD-binding subunit
MISHYYRPTNLEQALKLLSQPHTYPLGGGTVLAQRSSESFSVVDLQSLGLDNLRKSGNNLEIGATATLQQLLESVHIPKVLKTAIRIENPLNLRTLGTVAGALVTCDGRSSFGLVMLALDAKCLLVSDNTSKISLGEILQFRNQLLLGKLITNIEIPLNIKLAFNTVARTQADKSIVSAAMVQWPSGRTRLVLGGWGQFPTLAMDGNEADGMLEAAHNASAEAADEWASAEYRMEIAGILTQRCSNDLISL